MPSHDWFLRQWTQTLSTTQAELERRTGWTKRKASYLMTGKQPYKREDVNEASRALNIEPFELLMHPQDAFALRRLRENAIRIASDSHSVYRPAPKEDHDGKREAG